MHCRNVNHCDSSASTLSLWSREVSVSVPCSCQRGPRSPPAWWPFVLEAVAEKRWKMSQTVGFGGNPEQIQGWSAWTQQLLKACFCTDAELFANGVLWTWDLKEPWVFHGSERNLQKQKEKTYLELLWTALHPMHTCINSLVPCFIRHLE